MKRAYFLCMLVGCSQSATTTNSTPTNSQPSAPGSVPSSGSATVNIPDQLSSPFHVIAEGAPGFYVHKTAGNVFVTTGIYTSFLGSLTGDGLKESVELTKGLGLAGEVDFAHVAIEHVFGQWPKNAWLTFLGATGRSGYTTLHKWDGTSWISSKQTSLGVKTIAVIADDASAYQIASDEMADYSLVMPLSATSTAPKFEAFNPKEDMPAFRPSGNRRTRTVAHAAVAGPGGALAAGRCSMHWAKAQQNATCFDQFVGKESKFGVLPDFSVEAATSNKSAYYLGGKGTLSGIARVENGVAASVPTPAQWHVTSLAACDNDDLWALSAQGLWNREGGNWKEVALPHGLRAINVWVVEDEVFVAAEGDDKNGGSDKNGFLLSSKKHAPLKIRDEAFKNKINNIDSAVAYTSACQQPLVLLYEVRKTTAPDFAFADTAKALASFERADGLTFIDFAQGGKRFFAVKLSTMEVRTAKGIGGYTVLVDPKPFAKDLIATITKAMPGSKPQLVCHAPHASRRLRLDRKKGAFVPSGP